MPAQPAIVVVAHARPESTRRLLRSVRAADVPADARMIVSIDHGQGDRSAASAEVAAVVDAFATDRGRRVERVDHDGIGLVAHFRACADLSTDQPVILLEDDLLVGPGFYNWASAIVPVIERDPQVLGASLTAPWFDGFRHLRFEPIDDGTDAFYAQVPWYDGMVWTHEAWQSFRSASQQVDVDVPAAFDQLDEEEWFGDLVGHLVASGGYWALPRAAHATGTGAAGQHFEAGTDWFQSALAARARTEHAIVGVCDSGAVYDAHMEPTPRSVRRMAPGLPEDFVVDLLGVRDLRRWDPAALVLTTRPSARPVRSWGSAMHPLVMNVVHDEPGESIHLSEVRHVDTGPHADEHARSILVDHHRHGRHPGRRELLAELTGRRRRGG